MDGAAALKVLEAGGLSVVAGVPLPVVLLQVASGISRLITPDDVLNVVKTLEDVGNFAAAEAIKALHALGSLQTADTEPVPEYWRPG